MEQEWQEVMAAELATIDDLIESSLVSFGNYLFQKYGVDVIAKQEDGTIAYLLRKVTDADIKNWRNEMNTNDCGKPLGLS